MNALSLAERWFILPTLGVLDVGRARLLKSTSRFSRAFIKSRDLRMLAIAVFGCVTAAASAVLGPGYLLLLGPLLLGTPHLFFEARYLFFQTPGARSRILLSIIAAQTASVFCGSGIYTLGIACGLTAATVRTERRWLRITLVIAALLVQIAACIGPTWSRFLLLHGHNLLPLAVWCAWRRRPQPLSGGVLAIVCACCGAILFGCFDGFALRTPLSDGVFSLTRITDAVAGEFPNPWRHRLLLFFAFSQALHYVVWLRLIPEAARDRATPRSFRSSWRAYKADGPDVARLAVIASAAVPLLALLLGAVRIRSYYVTLSEFHATVELVLLTRLIAATTSVPWLARRAAKVPSGRAHVARD